MLLLLFIKVNFTKKIKNRIFHSAYNMDTKWILPEIKLTETSSALDKPSIRISLFSNTNKIIRYE